MRPPNSACPPPRYLRADAGRTVGTGIDLAVVPLKGRRKRLLIADMDSTMIRQECIDELADEAGVGAHVAGITARAMNGELDFEAALRERVALLEGLPEAVIGQVLRDRITLMPGGPVLLATMKAQGAHAALVSGGFTAFTGAIAARLGFDEHRANTLLVADGRLTGQVADPILGKEAKLQALTRITMRLGITPQTPSPWATGRTTCPCCLPPAPAWPCTPSPPFRRNAASASTTAT